jgi:adenine-specific DNA-methyltransferase
MPEKLEAARRGISESTSPATKAKLGQFLTPSDVAQFMAGMFRRDRDEANILDPGAGIGSLTAALVAALASRTRFPKTIRASLYEIDHNLATALKTTMEACKDLCAESGIQFSYQIHGDDFIESTASALVSPMMRSQQIDYDCVILNPPYRKLNSDTSTRRILSAAGIEVNNLYSAFLSLSARLLKEGGELVAITPRSFCNGVYFKAFRRDFFSRISLRAIHVYESRSRAFSDDAVLQENIIFHGIKSRARAAKVIISTSLGPHDPSPHARVVPTEEVLHPGDPELVVHIAADEAAQNAAHIVEHLRYGLHDLQLTISTGRVVDFRAVAFLRATSDGTTVPLIYPFNLENGRVVWPKPHARKATSIVACGHTRDLLVPSECYVLVKRFSAKEERKRLVAAVYDPDSVPYSVVGFENHLNYFHIEGRGLPPSLARGLAAFLNSTVADSYFRNFNGHTQVNAQDLRRFKYPTRRQLIALGEGLAGDVCDETAIDAALVRLLDGAKSV